MASERELWLETIREQVAEMARSTGDSRDELAEKVTVAKRLYSRWGGDVSDLDSIVAAVLKAQ